MSNYACSSCGRILWTRGQTTKRGYTLNNFEGSDFTKVQTTFDWTTLLVLDQSDRFNFYRYWWFARLVCQLTDLW